VPPAVVTVTSTETFSEFAGAKLAGAVAISSESETLLTLVAAADLAAYGSQ
jgi:hypothetical protein